VIVVATARWRLAVLFRSLLFIPPLALEAIFVAVMFAQAPQTTASVLDVSVVAMFALAVLYGHVNAMALASDGRNITAVAVGSGRALAGELGAGAAVVAAASLALLLAPLPVEQPVPSIGQLLLGLVALLAAGSAGLATATLVESLRVGPAPRFLTSITIITLTLARPVMMDHRGLAGAAAWAMPAVLATGRALGDHLADGPATILAGAAATLAWAVAVVLVTVAVRRRREDRP
jgi:hypothetical protein